MTAATSAVSKEDPQDLQLLANGRRVAAPLHTGWWVVTVLLVATRAVPAYLLVPVPSALAGRW